MDYLPLLKNGQVEYVLLRSCLSLPKFMYTMRTTDTTDHQLLWQECDSLIREAMSRILGVPLTTTQWQQAQLPVKMGGMGLFSAWDHAPAAYCTSYLSAHDLKLTILNKTEEESPPVITTAMLQYLSSKTGEEITMDHWRHSVSCQPQNSSEQTPASLSNHKWARCQQRNGEASFCGIATLRRLVKCDA